MIGGWGIWGVVLAIPIGYLLGCFTTSIFVGKAYKTDVRQHGSGNLGATNTLRVLGPVAGIISLVGDVGKAMLACWLGKLLGGDMGMLVAGSAALIGHTWPVFLRFKGGRAVAATIGIGLMVAPWLTVSVLVIAAIIIAITRYVSLASIVCAVLFWIGNILGAFVPFFGFFGTTWVHSLFATAWCALLIWRHKPNIQRLREGRENKISFKGKKA